MKNLHKIMTAGALILTFAATPVCAQSQDQQDQNQQNGQPTPPVQPVQPIPNPNNPPESSNTGDANVIPAVLTPDTLDVPLTGAMAPVFGVPPEHSYIVPLFEFVSTVDTNGGFVSGNNSQTITQQNVFGGLTLEKVDARNELSLNYLGGRSFSPNGDIYNSTTQLFGLQDKWVASRWNGVLADQLSYASEPLFGGFGTPSLGFGLPGATIQPGFQTNQSVFINRSPILNNTAIAEADYQTSPRGSLTFVGSYGLLHYYSAGLVNSSTAIGEAGYNYQLSERDTIGLSYLFDALRFGGNVESINDQVVEGSYGRHIARKVSLKIAAGPDIASIKEAGFASNTVVSWRVDSSLAYQLERATLSLSYAHMLSNGAGIFLGSKVDAFTGSATRKFTQVWSGHLSAGYARNSAIQGSSILPGFSGTVNSLFAGGGIVRAIGRNVEISGNYIAYYQTSGNKIATSNVLNNQLAVSFTWHPDPILLH